MFQPAIFRIAYIGFTFIASIILANVLTPAYFGKLSLLMLNASIISLVTGFGADSIVMHFLVNKQWNSRQAFSFVWVILSIQVLLFFIVQLGFYSFYSKTLLSQVSFRFLFFEFLYFLGLIVSEKYLILYYSFQRAKQVNILLCGIALLYLIVITFFLQYHTLDYFTVLKLLGFINLLQSVLVIFVFHMTIIRLKFSTIKWGEFKDAFKRSSIAMITNVVQLLAYRIDFWVIKLYHTEFDVGIYAQANKLANLIWIIPNILALLLIPKFSVVPKEYVPSIFRMAFLSNVLLTIVGILSAEFFYRFFLAEEYFPGLNSFYLMLPGYFFWATVIYFGAYFSFLGKFHYNFYASGACFLLITLFDFILVPRFSINGAAIANTVAYLLVLMLYILFFKNTLGFSLMHLLNFQKKDATVVKQVFQ
jgi:O-antigen/teichoic acid export membrane protein